MIEIIYESRGSFPFGPDDLHAMLAQARQRNEASGVTGVILYDRGVFLQVLEGDAAAVEATFARICRDPRHRNLFVLRRAPIAQHSFADWRMGFLSVSASPKALAGFSDFLHAGVLGLDLDAGSVARIVHAVRDRGFRAAIR